MEEKNMERQILEIKGQELFELHKNFHPKDMRDYPLKIEISGKGVMLWYTGYRNRKFYSVYWEPKMGSLENAFDISQLRMNANAVISYKEMIDNKDFGYFSKEDLIKEIKSTQEELKVVKEKYSEYFCFVDTHHQAMVETALEIEVKE